MAHRIGMVGMGAMALALAVPAHAGKSVPGVVSYVLASSAENGPAPSTWPFNALDGKPTTAWCTRGNGVGQRLVVGFMKSETITHITIVPGALHGDGLDRRHARVRELELNNGLERRMVTLADKADPQELQIEPPMSARQLQIIIKDVYPADTDVTPGACLGEVTLRNGPMELTGDGVARLVRGVPRNQLPLIGPWLDNPSAPERVLTFSLDGTFVWTYEPLMLGDPAAITGTWSVANGRLSLKLKGAPKAVVLKLSRDKVAGKQGTFETLALEGEGGHEKLPGTYQPAVSFPRQ